MAKIARVNTQYGEEDGEREVFGQGLGIGE